MWSLITHYCVEFNNTLLHHSIEITIHVVTNKHFVISFRMKLHKCKHCLRYFKHLKTLQRHQLRTHHSGMPVTCPNCPAHHTFGNNHELNLHLSSHPSRQLYICSVCEATFKSLLHLCSHQRICIRKCYPRKCCRCFRQFSSTVLWVRHCYGLHSKVKRKCSISVFKKSQPSLSPRKKPKVIKVSFCTVMNIFINLKFLCFQSNKCSQKNQACVFVLRHNE